MTAKEMLLIEANLRKYEGKHTVVDGVRYMEYRGAVFVWDASCECYREVSNA